MEESEYIFSCYVSTVETTIALAYVIPDIRY
jgi:hypothetical protein